MVQITNKIDIQAPPSLVYATLRDLATYPAWLRHSIVYRGTKVKADGSKTPPAYEDSTTVGRMQGELVEENPNHSIQFHQRKLSGSLDARIRYTLEATESGTAVIRVGEMTTRGFLHMMQPMLVRMAASESNRTLKALKSRVEQEASPAGQR